MSAAIEIASVVKRYGSFEALRGVSLSIREGEFFGLLGPNGAGKTTLISIVAGLSRPDSGEVRIMGHHVAADYRAARRALGVVPQELVFDPFFTVRETLRLTSGYYGIRRNDDWIDEILGHLDLTAKADANMRALSGGMKRRVLVAQALVHRPPVIVLDEPTCRGRRRAAPDPVAVHPQAEPRRPHDRADHPLSRGSAGTLVRTVSPCSSRGQVVALDDTSALLRRFAGGRLQLTLSGAPMPQALAALRLEEGGQAPAADRPAGQDGAQPGAAGAPQKVALRIDDFAGMEGILAALREGGCRIDEMELQRTDLEDVFVQIMKDNR